MALFKSIVNFLYKVWDEIIVNNPTPPVPAPVESDTAKIDNLSALMLQTNAPYVEYYPKGGDVINAEIHTISASAALSEAKLIVSNSEANNLDYVYLASCIFQESKFDPACFNHNLTEYNGVESFDGTDWGMCQMSGYYLPTRPGMAGLTQAQMQIKAMTAEWAVPVMAEIMADNLADAITDMPSVSSIMPQLNTTELSNEEFLATLYYNRGRSGGLEAVKSLDYANMQHPFMVAKWFAQFKTALETGQPVASHVMLKHEAFAPHIRR
jgi:hypothetical protein